MSAPATSFLLDFVDGWAQELVAAPFAAAFSLAWQLTGQYDAGDWGIWTPTMPTDPDKAVVLTPSVIGNDPTRPQTQMGLQIRVRGARNNKSSVLALDGAICDWLLGLYPVTLPNDIRVSTLIQTSSGSMGTDDSNRLTWSSRYSANTHRPSPHRK